ncbi:MAG: serine/threonine protein kinase [Deltaproteobacteria bacterium]|nr:serine/threonine protein kinase [Deltaproteobacteria bacterium]
MEPSPPLVEAGALLGPYRLIARLGKGAMGDVWRARDERLDRDVAVKLLPPDLAGDPERRARMLREARAAAAVGHANVVTLYDILSDGDTDILVMELVDGQTLTDTLRKHGPPEPRDAIRWLTAIADALSAAHGRGILHRDMKSANVMLTAAGQVKVLDFGLAKLRDDPIAPAAPTAPLDEPAASAMMATLADTTDRTTPGTAARREAAPDLGTRSTAPRAAAAVEVALDATMPSSPAMTAPGAPPAMSASARFGSSPRGSMEAYQTRAGAMLGTPMYMAPEQIAGNPPDERTEVFAVGVIAYELCTGKPPYSARSLDELFGQITRDPAPPLPERVPAPLAAVVMRALAKDPLQRFASMNELKAALATVERTLFAPRRWPWIAAFVAVAIAAAVIAWVATRTTTEPVRPGDEYVTRALQEYDVFYGDKALSSLRAALRVAPDHPRANAYMILFGGTEADRATAATTAERILATTAGKDRALLDIAVALERRGPRAARAAATAAEAPDRELAFWAAEMAFRAADYPAASGEYDRLLDDPAPAFRGRIYDHDSAVLLWQDLPDKALRIGTLYRDAFPGEADAIGVYGTTLAAAGRVDDGIAAAKDALAMAEGEDTLAGLGKLYAIKGDLPKAIDLYRQSMQRAGDSRRPVRRAALGLLQWMTGDVDGARATVAPCLPGGADAAIPQRGACLFVAGVLDPAQSEIAARALDDLEATASDLHPAYGRPAALAMLVRNRARFFGGGCVITVPPPLSGSNMPSMSGPVTPPPPPAPPDAATLAALAAAADQPLDFYATYHVPFFQTWATCELAAARAAAGDRPAAAKLLEPRARDRWWLTDDLARYRP